MNIDFGKNEDGLIPVIIQHFQSYQVLMLGYMNEPALQQTIKQNRVTFYSRSKKRLWTKGETSGHFLNVKQIFVDCDKDTLLIMVNPMGATCHRGTASCFDNNLSGRFIYQLEQVISDRIRTNCDHSYTYSLYKKGINKIAQKVGEEAIELVIEAKDDNRDLFIGEASDLMYHYLLLLRSKKVSLSDIEKCLKKRSHQ